jgi:hypothetical protein
MLHIPMPFSRSAQVKNKFVTIFWSLHLLILFGFERCTQVFPFSDCCKGSLQFLCWCPIYVVLSNCLIHHCIFKILIQWAHCIMRLNHSEHNTFSINFYQVFEQKKFQLQWNHEQHWFFVFMLTFVDIQYRLMRWNKPLFVNKFDFILNYIN